MENATMNADIEIYTRLSLIRDFRELKNSDKVTDNVEMIRILLLGDLSDFSSETIDSAISVCAKSTGNESSAEKLDTILLNIKNNYYGKLNQSTANKVEILSILTHLFSLSRNESQRSQLISILQNYALSNFNANLLSTKFVKNLVGKHKQDFDVKKVDELISNIEHVPVAPLSDVAQLQKKETRKANSFIQRIRPHLAKLGWLRKLVKYYFGKRAQYIEWKAKRARSKQLF